MEHLHRSRFEMNHNFGHLGRHLLSGTDIKRHSLPTPVIHIQTHRHVGICTGIRTNILFFTITDTVITSNILSADNIITDILISQRTKGLVDLDHLVTETILVKLGRWFHGSNSKQLHQMVLYHIAQSSRPVIISSASTYTHIFHRSDFYIIYIVTIPYRFVNSTSKTGHHNILHRFLAQKMIDAVDILFFKISGIDFI